MHRQIVAKLPEMHEYFRQRRTVRHPGNFKTGKSLQASPFKEVGEEKHDWPWVKTRQQEMFPRLFITGLKFNVKIKFD